MEVPATKPLRPRSACLISERPILLRRGVLERRNGKEGSAFSGSKESTPAAAMASDQELDDDTLPNLQRGSADGTERKWITHAFKGNEQPSRSYELDETYQRTVYNLYCNGNVYCFFRLFETLYSRLLAIKNNEAAVHDAAAKAFGEGGQPKAAVTLRMIDKLPKDFFQYVGPTANYYRQIIQMCEEVISGLTDLSHLEETLRRYYMQTGWQLYTIDKLLSAIIRFIMNIIGSDSKDRSRDIINLFNKDREMPRRVGHRNCSTASRSRSMKGWRAVPRELCKCHTQNLRFSFAYMM